MSGESGFVAGIHPDTPVFSDRRSRDRRSRNRRSALKESKVLDERSIVFKPTGFFTDYAERWQIKSQTEALLALHGESSSSAWQGGGQSSVYAAAAEIFNREAFVSSVTDAVLRFYKKIGHPSWSAPTGALLKYASEIRKWKQAAVGLKMEVQQFNMTHRVLMTVQINQKLQEAETVAERRQRVQSFWPQYHHGPKRMELRPASAPMPVHRSDNSAYPHVLQDSSKHALVLDWTTRAARSRSAVGKWDWCRPRPVSAAERKSSHAKKSHESSRDTWVASSLGRKPSLDILHETRKRTSCSLPSLHVDRAAKLANVDPCITRTAVAAVGGRSEVRHPVPRASVSSGTDGATAQYMRACEKSHIVPTPMAFATGHSMEVDTEGKHLNDRELAALTTLVRASGIEKIKLQGNSNLSDKALNEFVVALRASPSRERLAQLNLSGCLHAGQRTAGSVVRLLADGAQHLQHLDLSSVPMGVQHHLSFCKSVHAHPSLQALHLKDVGLGKAGDNIARQCIIELLSSKTLRKLDLSWNHFSADVFAHLGERLVETKGITWLGLANCAAATSVPGAITPVAYFIEKLTSHNPLVYLDLSLNRIDFRCALIVEDTFANSKMLRQLDISDNPLGVIGMRSILRLLALDHSGLEQFKCDACGAGQLTGSKTDFQVFSATNPGGKYNLDLARPYHRALLRMLYKVCRCFELQESEAFVETRYSKGAWKEPPEVDGVRSVPTDGKFAVSFSVVNAMERESRDVQDSDFQGVIQGHLRLAAVKPGCRKVICLLAQWDSLKDLPTEQDVMLEALASDFLLTFPQIEHLCRTREKIPDILRCLLHCVTGGQMAHYLCMLLPATLADCLRATQRLQTFFAFNIENPTGRYKLDLGDVVNFAVAEKVVLLDTWETSVKKRRGWADGSQRGNYSHVRNVKYNASDLPSHPISTWSMPQYGLLALDYASGARAPLNATPVDRPTLTKILLAMQSMAVAPVIEQELPPEVAQRSKLQALRMTSHLYYITALQMREILGTWTQERVRADCLVMFFNRIADMHNEKVFRVRFEDFEELKRLRDRLGYASLFPYIQPEFSKFELDLANQDERLVANAVVVLAAKERIGNLREPSFVHANGTVDPLPLGVPRSWEFLEKMPRSGIFCVSYVCAPEDRNFKVRAQMHEKFGGFHMDVAEDSVMWWGGLLEAPVEVLTYLDFLVSRFDNMYDAFKEIDGPGGNGVITLQEFKESFQNMGCKKFDGPNEAKTIATIFRFLDPSGEGQVSLGEWGVLEQLAREVNQSIREFVQFCERTFGGGLPHAWNFLDEDGSGEITEAEWVNAVKHIGFMGPSKRIFAFLDKDDEGTVSLEEFNLLERFRSRPQDEHGDNLSHSRSL